MFTPYCYLIGWSTLDRWYYGSEFSTTKKIANPTNLFNPASKTPYYTSSKIVKDYIDSYGMPDVVLIRKTFKCAKKCRSWEGKVLRRLNVVDSSRWLNQSCAKAIPPMFGDNNPSKRPDVRVKISEAKIRANRGEPKPKKRKVLSEEHKKKISESRKKFFNTAAGSAEKERISRKWSGRQDRVGAKASNATKEKMRVSSTGMIYITNGTTNTKIKRDQPIPCGWYPGRVHKIKDR